MEIKNNDMTMAFVTENMRVEKRDECPGLRYYCNILLRVYRFSKYDLCDYSVIYRTINYK